MRWHVICRKPKSSWRPKVKMYFQNPRPLLQETIIWNKQFSSGYLPRHCFPHQPSQLGSFFVKYRKSLSKPRDSILSQSLQTWNRSTQFRVYSQFSGVDPGPIIAEAQKPKTFRVATFYAQQLSGRSAQNRFSQKALKTRFCLSRHCQRMRNECPCPHPLNGKSANFTQQG